MRTSNWVVLGIFAALSAFFLWLWFYLRFDAVNWPLGLVLSVIWWAVIVAGAVLIARSGARHG